MKLKELSESELKKLYDENKWFSELIDSCAYDSASWCEGEEFDHIGAKVFDYHEHYNSFYLTVPRVYGAPAPEKIVGELNKDYLPDELAKKYDELCELNAKMEDAEEWDEDRPEYKRMCKLADELADGLTEHFKAYEDISGYVEQELADIREGYSGLGELELVDGKIKEVLWH